MKHHIILLDLCISLMNFLTGPFSMPVILQMKCQLEHTLPRTERERGEIVTTFQLSHFQYSACCLMIFQFRIVQKANMSSCKNSFVAYPFPYE